VDIEEDKDSNFIRVDRDDIGEAVPLESGNYTEPASIKAYPGAVTRTMDRLDFCQIILKSLFEARIAVCTQRRVICQTIIKYKIHFALVHFNTRLVDCRLKFSFHQKRKFLT